MLLAIASACASLALLVFALGVIAAMLISHWGQIIRALNAPYPAGSIPPAPRARQLAVVRRRARAASYGLRAAA